MSGKFTLRQAVPPTIPASSNLDTLSVKLLKAGEIIGGTAPNLPAPLVSIAELTTVNDEMIYTVATDTYATTKISSAGRSFLTADTASDQQSALALVPGIDVQAHSTTLDSVNTIASGTANQLMYTTGTAFSTTGVTAFTRSDILTAVDADDLASNTGFIIGPLSQTNRLMKVSGTNTVTETTLSVDGSNNLTGLNDLTVGNELTVTGNIDGITPTERTQLTNINSTTISSTQWGYLGETDQGIATTDTPSFTGADMNSQRITGVLNPTNAQDAATKTYVDTTASTGAPPLSSVVLATALVVLPNSPVYASPAETLTSTGGPGTLAVDGVTVVVGNRILIKDQADNRQNGIYVVTDDGATPGPNWVLTRSIDFNQASMPKSAGTSVFIEITSGAVVNPGSTGALGSTVSDVDPLTDIVDWVQTGGGVTFTAGQGIDSTALTGGTIQTDVSTRLKYTTNSIDLNTVTVPYGGTGQVTLGSGNVLIGNGTGDVGSTKAAPTGNFVGTTDTQTLTNKTLTNSTNNVYASALFTGSGTGAVNFFSAVAPTIGQKLTATSGTTATWQDAGGVEPDRTLIVYQSAPNSSPNYSTLGAALTAASALTPTTTNHVIIFMYPGTYSESIPLIVPEYVTISTLAVTSSHVIIRPTVPAPSSAVFTLSGNTRIGGIVIDGFDGSAGYSTIGVDCIGGTTNSVDIIDTCTVQNCSNANIRVTGDGTTPFGRILLCKNIVSIITASFPFTCISGTEVQLGGFLSGSDITISGFLTAGAVMTNGLYIHDKLSFGDVVNLNISSTTNGIVIGGAGTENSDINYPQIRCTQLRMGLVSTIVIDAQAKCKFSISSLLVDDDLALYPDQLLLRSTNPSLPSDPNLLIFVDGKISHTNISLLNGATNNLPTLGGLLFTQEARERIMNVFDRVAIGTPISGKRLVVGEGEAHTRGVFCFHDDGGVFTNITDEVAQITDTFPIICELATTSSINLVSAPATIDGVAPVSGVTLVLVKDGSTANVGTDSVDNGVYLWNGTGSAMTRSSLFATGETFKYNTFFHADSGTVNYGGFWTIDTSSINIAVVVGTTSFALSARSAKLFPTIPADDDALYIGSSLLLLFPGVKILVSAAITLSSGTLDQCIIWEFWDGSAWLDLKLMTVYSGPPYTNFGSTTFGFGDPTIGTTSHAVEYSHRFGTLNNWATTTVNGVNAYWVRCRLLSATNLDVNPVISDISIHTNNTEITTDGFLEYFGKARPVEIKSWTTRELVEPDGGGMENPSSQVMEPLNSGGDIISFGISDCRFRISRDVAIGQNFILPTNMDTSEPCRVKITYAPGSGSGNVAIEVLYCFTQTGSVIGNIDGASADATKFTSGVDIVTITAGTGVQDTFNFDLDVSSAVVGEETLWFQFRRLAASNGSDTFSDDISILNISIQYRIWSNGGYSYV